MSPTQGVNPDIWILPPMMKTYVATRKENASYFLRGPDAQKYIESAMNGGSGDQVGDTPTPPRAG